ncbi:hypothetical protein [Pseudothermotoga thermarum]|uniref:Uncharacterized protein n=1 Tax=Pseudothermotoga thermarum DSM 5069 TaxID=688269 RepID=F7YYF0_9THEM|nr:hypothetical protein [Pseudothermotoga thermarum]AEH50974.1 hypothetical protein Theth_0890 [Pseudothermotoga thermarum DSM 5069]
MTLTGMAVLIFIICTVLSLVFLNQAYGRVSSVTVQPFPKVMVVSPVANLLAMAKNVVENLFFYSELLNFEFDIMLTSAGKEVVFETRSLKAYEEIKLKVQKKQGIKVPEQITYLKIDEKTFITGSSFKYKTNVFTYRCSIILSNDGQILNNPSDIADVLLKALKGDQVTINRNSKVDLLEPLKMFANKYSIQVVNQK